MPKTKFCKKSELEKLISIGGFQIIESVKLSRLPEYFIVAKKMGTVDEGTANWPR